MTAIPRRLQKIFAGGLTPSGNVAEFGSLAAGAPAYSGDPDDIQTPAWLNGLTAALVGNRSPAVQDLNGLFLVITQQLAYILQAGIPEWDVDTEYFTDGMCRVAGSIYVSLTDNNTGNNPTSDTTNWIPFTQQMKGPAVCRAWAVFDGINATGGDARIISSFNVSTITKNAAGSYTVNFATALPTANYTLGGSCGAEDGQGYGAGDNGVVVGQIAGQGNAIRSAASCRLFTINPNTLALVSSGCVSVFFFG